MTPISWINHAKLAISRGIAGPGNIEVTPKRVETFAELCEHVASEVEWPCTDACDAADASNGGLSHVDCEHHVG